VPASERLPELLRQRAMLRDQLERLEREIALVTAGAATRPAEAPLPPPETSPPGATAHPHADPSALLADLLAEEKGRGFSKVGCWAGFAAVMLTVIAIVLALGHFLYR
jgi:hypothetical protein